jgi:hypothetical protein
MSVTMAALIFVGAVVLDAVVEPPVDGVELLEHPAAKPAKRPIATTAATYLIHFDLT